MPYRIHKLGQDIFKGMMYLVTKTGGRGIGCQVIGNAQNVIVIFLPPKGYASNVNVHAQETWMGTKPVNGRTQKQTSLLSTQTHLQVTGTVETAKHTILLETHGASSAKAQHL